MQYSKDRDGPWKLYVYDHNGFHRGGIWFRKGPMRFPDEEISLVDARNAVQKAIAQEREVKVCDGGDELVYHWKDGKIQYGDSFWDDIIK